MADSFLIRLVMVAAGAAISAGLLATPGTPRATPAIHWDDVAVPDEAATLNVLFVGNSLTFSNDLPGILERLLEAGDAGPAHVESVAYPNFGLIDHWSHGASRESIARVGWDVVILQQGPSATEGRPSLLEYAKRFDEIIRPTGARTALYQVWPAGSRSFDFEGVRESYRMAAARVDGSFYPAGAAWQIAWERDADLPLYGKDGFHPSPMGTYLAALVIYEQLAGKSPVGLPARIRTDDGAEVRLSGRTAKLLQEAAAEANKRHALPQKSTAPTTGER